jgi:hypothetical protein
MSGGNGSSTGNGSDKDEDYDGNIGEHGGGNGK